MLAIWGELFLMSEVPRYSPLEGWIQWFQRTSSSAQSASWVRVAIDTLGAIGISRETGYDSGYGYYIPPYGTAYRRALRTTRTRVSGDLLLQGAVGLLVLRGDRDPWSH